MMTMSADDVMKFFDACETGKGWEVCSEFCLPDASFASQAEPLVDVTTIAAYADWMKGLCSFIPDASYDLKSFTSDVERGHYMIYAVFSGTHTGEGGPLPATGKSTKSDYVYVIETEGGKISRMTKIWNAGWAMKELGWV